MAAEKQLTLLQEKLENLPALPGVYLFKDAQGNILYVGKAKNLRSRVRSYFQKSRPADPKLQAMLRRVADLDTILVDSEVEAVMLEANLIKEHRPRYNVVLRDDKSYPYIRITNEPYPRVFVTRRVVNDGSRYLGPYTDVKHLRHIMKALRKIFPIRSCKFYIDDQVIARKKIKVCLDYHIKRCQGPCEGLVSQEEYQHMIRQVERFLKGKTRELLRELHNRMEQAAREWNFEEAARLRDQIALIEQFSFSNQRVVQTDFEDRDVVAIALDEEDACTVVFKIREGKVIARQHFYLTGVEEKTEAEVLTQFLKQYYLSADSYPHQVLLAVAPEEEQAVLENWLSQLAGHRVEIVLPRIGEKRKLVELCQKNARFLLEELQLHRRKRKDYVPYNVRELQKALQLAVPPRRIEAFDISNIQGKDAVASLVCFVDGKPRKSEYRVFKIRSKDTPDDFAMMREAVFRRYRRVLEEKKPLPDLILIDGGKGQLSSAISALRELGIENQPIIGLAKRLEEIYLPGVSEPQTLPRRNPGLRLLQHLRDESHRFALLHFRKQHQKSTLKSPLDDVPGIGPKRKARLLQAFGSLKNISRASLEELMEKGQLPRPVARTLYQTLHADEHSSPGASTLARSESENPI